MLNRNGIMVSLIAKLMLVYFVLTVIPIDLYHHHEPSRSLKANNTAYKVHHHTKNARLSSYCLICNLHLNKKNDLPVTGFVVMLFTKEVCHSYGFISSLHEIPVQDITYRGPPSFA
ncbi:hypothetical protein [Olivibacter sp. XZL3]|uniref:hypothetical protein n=1 Tax=Olivibacter sp. XZL3 TaxID=1735116 RepID=UPI001065C3B4|nr:hypothetical protein [Olivibacter sp. XZL3]